MEGGSSIPLASGRLGQGSSYGTIEARDEDTAARAPASESSAVRGERKVAEALDAYFHVSARGSTLRTEFLAGFVNFVANSYLLVLIPRILERGGVPPAAATTSFVISTALGSLILGLLANLPVPVGPGLGCAAFFAYGMTGTGETTDFRVTQNGITVCFSAALAMTLLSVLDVPRNIFGAVPDSVKSAMPVGLGLLLSLCGFQHLGLVVSDPYTGVRMTHAMTLATGFGVLGVLCMAYMDHKGFGFSKFVVPLAFFTVLAWAVGVAPLPEAVAAIPTVGSGFIRFTSLTRYWWSPVFGLLVICLFDIGGITRSVCRFTGILDQSKQIREPIMGASGSVTGEYWVYVACSVASLASAVLGGTPVIAFGESFAGAEVGGRTGLTSITSAGCFLLSLPFEPILHAVPLCASAPVLVLLGAILLKLTKGLELEDMADTFPSFCTIALMPFLYSIDRAIWAGLVSWGVMRALDMVQGFVWPNKNETDETSGKAATPAERAEVTKRVLALQHALEIFRNGIEDSRGDRVGVGGGAKALQCLEQAMQQVREAEVALAEGHRDADVQAAPTETPIRRRAKCQSSIHELLTPTISALAQPLGDDEKTDLAMNRVRL